MLGGGGEAALAATALQGLWRDPPVETPAFLDACVAALKTTLEQYRAAATTPLEKERIYQRLCVWAGARLPTPIKSLPAWTQRATFSLQNTRAELESVRQACEWLLLDAALEGGQLKKRKDLQDKTGANGYPYGLVSLPELTAALARAALLESVPPSSPPTYPTEDQKRAAALQKELEGSTEEWPVTADLWSRRRHLLTDKPRFVPAAVPQPDAVVRLVDDKLALHSEWEIAQHRQLAEVLYRLAIGWNHPGDLLSSPATNAALVTYQKEELQQRMEAAGVSSATGERERVRVALAAKDLQLPPGEAPTGPWLDPSSGAVPDYGDPRVELQSLALSVLRFMRAHVDQGDTLPRPLPADLNLQTAWDAVLPSLGLSLEHYLTDPLLQDVNDAESNWGGTMNAAVQALAARTTATVTVYELSFSPDRPLQELALEEKYTAVGSGSLKLSDLQRKRIAILYLLLAPDKRSDPTQRLFVPLVFLPFKK
jgi:hypothetical protein